MLRHVVRRLRSRGIGSQDCLDQPDGRPPRSVSALAPQDETATSRSDTRKIAYWDPDYLANILTPNGR